MGEVKQLPGKIFCILCNGVVAFKNGDKSRFVGHMNHEHEAFSGINFVLAGCLMTQEERSAVETIMEEKYNAGMIDVKRVEDESSDENPTKLTDTVDVEQEDVSSEVNTIETVGTKLNENVPNEDKEPSSEKEELDGGNVSPKVKISMRSFLLENKNLLSKAKSEEHSNKRVEEVGGGAVNEVDTTESPSAQNGGQFQCESCTANFKVISSLRRHVIKNHGVKNKVETGPEQISSTPTSKAVSSSKSYESKILPVQLPSSTQLESSNSEFQSCKKCDAKFKLESNLDKHMKIAHPEPVVVKPIKQDPEKNNDATGPPPTLVIGPKLIVKTVEALNNSVGNPVDKSECKEKVDSWKEVLMKTEHDDSLKVSMDGDLKTLKCDQCSKKFMMERNLNLHKRVAHGRTSGRKKSLHKVPKFNFTCAPCNIRFESKTHLDNHEKTSHKNESSREDGSSKVEKVSISKVSEPKNSAPLNLKSSKQSLKVLKSIKKEPGVQTQLPCGKCQVVFGNEIALKRHNIKRHGANSLRCITCKKTFKTKREYHIHMKHVHPAKPGKFACNICNFSLQHNSSLRRHREQQHGIIQSRKDSSEEAKDKEASFVIEMKKKIVDDKEEKLSSIKSKDSVSSYKTGNISVTLEESPCISPTGVDLSTSQYFVSHPSMLRPLTKKMHQKLLDKKMIIEDRNLPTGWFILNTLRKGKQGNKEFITPDRKVIRSVDGMREYMRVSNDYSRAEIQRVSKYFRRRMSI